jgi:hypothetical protein
MLGGDLSAQTIATALNLPSVGSMSPAQYLTSQCTASYSAGQLSDVQGICYVPGTGMGAAFSPVDGSAVTNGTIQTTGIETAAVNAYARFYPAANRMPQPVAGANPNGTNGALTDGINYVNDLLASHNGFQYRARIDENISDNSKVYATFNWEKINDESPAENIYYYPAGTIPYPTPEYSHTRAYDLSINFTHIFSPTLTNELVAAGVHFYQPNQLQNPNLVSVATTGFPFAGHYSNGQSQIPSIIDYQIGTPSFAMSDFPNNSVYFRKYSWNVGDNVSKQFRTHSLKFGVYLEQTANNQVQLGNYAQGEYIFASYDYCTPNGGVGSNIGNAVGNFLVGCSQTYIQNSGDPAADMNYKTIAFYATDEWKVNRRLTLTLGARLDHLGPWLDAHGVGLAIWQPTPGMFNANINPNNPTTWPGISWHQQNSSIPLGGRNLPLAFVSPRVGLAFDVFGDGMTVVRGGFGSYRFQSSYNDYAGPLITTLGVGTYTSPSSCTYEQNANMGGQSCTAPSVPSPFAIYAIDPRDHQQPVTYNYNFTIDRQLPRDTFLEIGYVGNQSTQLSTEGNLSNQNAIPMGGLFQPDPCTSNCNGIPGQVYQPGSTVTVGGVSGVSTVPDFRPYRNYEQVYVTNHVGYGNYNALQASLKRQKGAFIYGANYTFSKALGIRSDYRTGYASDPTVLAHNYGNLGFDRSQILNFVYSYQEGNLVHGNKLLQGIANGWEISGITGWQSGPDVSVIANGSTNFGLNGGIQWTEGTQTISLPGSSPGSLTENLIGTPDITLQPVVTCNPRSNLGKHQYMNGSCFGLPPLGTNGPFNLPYLHGPAYFNTDLSLFKDFRLGEKKNLQFRLAGFNFLNHPINTFYGGVNTGYTLSFTDPTNTTFNTEQQALAGAVAAGGFGSTPYKIGRRVVELGVKYDF